MMEPRLKHLRRTGAAMFVLLTVRALAAASDTAAAGATGPPPPKGAQGASPRPGPLLEVFVENAADPFSRPDGTGYANDVVRAAFAAVNVDIVLTIVPYVRCKAKVLDGSAALCFSMSWLKEFEGRVKFADTPLFSVTPVYFENPAHPLAARNEEELGKGIRIGTIRGYEYPASTLRARDRGAVFVDGSSAAANLKKLAAGRLDAAMVMADSLNGARLWIDQARVGNLVREAFKCPSVQVAFLGASTRNPRGMWAIEKYNRGIAIISKNGVLDSIRKRW